MVSPGAHSLLKSSSARVTGKILFTESSNISTPRAFVGDLRGVFPDGGSSGVEGKQPPMDTDVAQQLT
jgi:hypothetical protein